MSSPVVAAQNNKNEKMEVSLSRSLKSEQDRLISLPATQDLPPGMQELAKNSFVPGAEAYFQRQSNLPLLSSTNMSILERLQSPQANNTNLSFRNENTRTNGKYMYYLSPRSSWGVHRF